MFVKEIINCVVTRSLAVAAVTLMLSACSSGIEGTYSGSATVSLAEVSLQVTFDSDTVIIKSHVSMMGQTAGQTETEHEYELDGNRIKVKNMQGVTQIWTVADDGSISVPMGPSTIKLTRTSDDKAEVSTGGHEAMAEATDSGFSFSKVIASLIDPDVEGTYTDGAIRLETIFTFESDGNGTMSMYETQFPFEYIVDGKHVKITGLGDGLKIFNLNDDGSLTGMGLTLTKKTKS